MQQSKLAWWLLAYFMHFLVWIGVMIWLLCINIICMWMLRRVYSTVCVCVQSDNRKSARGGRFKCQVCRLQFSSINVSCDRVLLHCCLYCWNLTTAQSPQSEAICHTIIIMVSNWYLVYSTLVLSYLLLNENKSDLLHILDILLCMRQIDVHRLFYS